MQFDDMYLVTKKLKPIAQEEIDNLNNQLGITLPDAYGEFMVRLGEGSYCDLIQLYPPQRILDEYVEVRQRWDEYWFFERSKAIFTKSQALESVILGDTYDGDEFVFYPPHPDKLYALPRHDEHIHVLSADFSDLIYWNGAGLGPTPRFRSFEPYHQRKTLERLSQRTDWRLEDLFNRFRARWSNSPLHRVTEPGKEYIVFYLQEIGGRIQIVGGNGSVVRLTAYYDSEAAPDVMAFVESLGDSGFMLERRR